MGINVQINSNYQLTYINTCFLLWRTTWGSSIVLRRNFPDCFTKIKQKNAFLWMWLAEILCPSKW